LNKFDDIKTSLPYHFTLITATFLCIPNPSPARTVFQFKAGHLLVKAN